MPRHHDAALPAPGVAPRRLQVFTPPTYPVHTSLVSSPQRWQVRLRVEPTRRQERQGPSEEQHTAGAIPQTLLLAEHTTANAWEEPSTRLSVLARAGPRGRPASDVARSSRSACTATRMAGDYLRVYERLIEHKAERASKA